MWVQRYSFFMNGQSFGRVFYCKTAKKGKNNYLCEAILKKRRKKRAGKCPANKKTEEL